MSRGRRHGTGEHAPFDPFRILALLGIVIGLMIVVGGFVVWFFTGRESSLIMGSGLVMATGGGLRELLESALSRLPGYEPPPSEIPEYLEHPRRPPPYDYRHHVEERR